MSILRPATAIEVDPAPAPPTRLYRSGEELAMRDLIVPELRRRYPDARIVHELPLRYSSNRIDLAAIRPNEIISVEIKSSRDVADRLEAQIRAFLPISSRVIVALAPKWNEQLPYKVIESSASTSYVPQSTPMQELIEHIGGATETWTVDAEQAAITVTRDHYRDALPNTAELLHMLHVAELTDIAGRHRVLSGKARHVDLVRACFDLMTGREIVTSVCAALRARDAFAHGTDAPIKQAEGARG